MSLWFPPPRQPWKTRKIKIKQSYYQSQQPAKPKRKAMGPASNWTHRRRSLRSPRGPCSRGESKFRPLEKARKWWYLRISLASKGPRVVLIKRKGPQRPGSWKMKKNLWLTWLAWKNQVHHQFHISKASNCEKHHWKIVEALNKKWAMIMMMMMMMMINDDQHHNDLVWNIYI